MSNVAERKRVLDVLEGKYVPRVGDLGFIRNGALSGYAVLLCRLSDSGKTAWFELAGCPPSALPRLATVSWRRVAGTAPLWRPWRGNGPTWPLGLVAISNAGSG